MRLLFAHEMKCSAVEVKEREPKEGKEREKKLQFNTSSASVQWIELSGRKIWLFLPLNGYLRKTV